MTINYKNLKKVDSSLKPFLNARLMIVSKNRSLEDIKELIKNNYKIFGENRVQEAKNKFNQINNLEKIDLNLIGPLQTNKVKDALLLFDCIQTIDRKKLIDEIYRIKCKSHQIKTKSYYIQINIGSEKQKSGINKSDIVDLYNYAISKELNVIGLMCIPPNTVDPESFFQEMNTIKNEINNNLMLSMGMSNDYEIALKNKSNLIRVGSLIFND